MDVGVKGLDANSDILVPMNVLYPSHFILQHISISNIYSI